MKKKVAINGFGRIGRLVARVLLSKESDLELVAVNDLSPADNLGYLFKYDSTHGIFPGKVEVPENQNKIIINNKEIVILAEKDPSQLPWKKMGIDYVVESTGIFTDYEGALKHINAGAKRVLISAPAKGDKIPTYVIGVNHENYSPQNDFIISNASCTTNCLGPLVKIIYDHFGVKEALMTTVHAMTASQPTVDGSSKKDWRGGRSAGVNIIPASTGAAKALALCMPQLKGKITGMAFRVPVVDVSVVDLTVKVEKETNYKEICETIKSAAAKELKGILEYCNEELVSTDFIGNTHSSIFDVKAGIELNSSFFKLVSWYDNEMGYSNRVVDLLKIMGAKEK